MLNLTLKSRKKLQLDVFANGNGHASSDTDQSPSRAPHRTGVIIIIQDSEGFPSVKCEQNILGFPTELNTYYQKEVSMEYFCHRRQRDRRLLQLTICSYRFQLNPYNAEKNLAPRKNA